MKAEDLNFPDGASCPRDGIKTLQEAFDQLFTELDEIKADIEQARMTENKQTQVINNIVKDLEFYKPALNAAHFIFADNPEVERQLKESKEIFLKTKNLKTEKENTK